MATVYNLHTFIELIDLSNLFQSATDQRSSDNIFYFLRVSFFDQTCSSKLFSAKDFAAPNRIQFKDEPFLSFKIRFPQSDEQEIIDQLRIVRIELFQVSITASNFSKKQTHLLSVYECSSWNFFFASNAIDSNYRAREVTLSLIDKAQLSELMTSEPLGPFRSNKLTCLVSSMWMHSASPMEVSDLQTPSKKPRSSISPKTQTKLVPYEDSDSEGELEVDPYYEKQKKTITFQRCYACSKGLGEHTHEIERKRPSSAPLKSSMKSPAKTSTVRFNFEEEPAGKIRSLGESIRDNINSFHSPQKVTKKIKSVSTPNYSAPTSTMSKSHQFEKWTDKDPAAFQRILNLEKTIKTMEWLEEESKAARLRWKNILEEAQRTQWQRSIHAVKQANHIIEEDERREEEEFQKREREASKYDSYFASQDRPYQSYTHFLQNNRNPNFKEYYLEPSLSLLRQQVYPRPLPHNYDKKS